VLAATPLGLPDAPGDLVAEAGNGFVRITWLQPLDKGGSAILQYEIYRGPSEDDLEMHHTIGRSTLTYQDDDVVVGTTYHYAVSVVTIAGEGPRSRVASGTPYGPAGPPRSLEAVASDGEVYLFWEAPGDDGASPIEGYVIMRGTSSSDLRELAQLADVTSYLDTSVSNDQTYYYVVAAINKAGPGERSESVSAMPFEPVTVPDSIPTLVADAKGTKVTLQWTAPQDDGGSPVTGYVILRGFSSDALEVGAGVYTWSDEGLKRGTTYHYSVLAKNDVGEGEPIAAREVKVPKAKEDGPGFEVLVVVAAVMLVAAIMRRREVE
jgi:PGF-CTERM protein